MPVAVVSSGSMMPTFYRGDIVLVERYSSNYAVGDVILFDVAGGQIPWIHRVIEVREAVNGEVFYLTKGDHNERADREVYLNEDKWLRRENTYGRVFAVLPYVGQFSLLMTEVPFLREFFIALIGLLYLVSQNGLQ